MCALVFDPSMWLFGLEIYVCNVLKKVFLTFGI